MWKDVSETFHLSLLLMVLTSLPCSLVLGIDPPNWRRVFLLDGMKLSPIETSLWWTVIGSIVGAWLGAVPIPLDWDRPWQLWPISCVIGTLLGYIIGLVIGSVAVIVKTVEDKLKNV